MILVLYTTSTDIDTFNGRYNSYLTETTDQIKLHKRNFSMV